MSWMKRYYEDIVERLEKAFPELTFDEIISAMTESNNADETLFKCMFEAEKKNKKPYFVKYNKNNKINYSNIKFKVIIKGYSRNPLVQCTKVFSSKEDMDNYLHDLLEYVDNSIDEYGFLTVGDMKEFLKFRNDIEFSDYGYGWKDYGEVDSYSVNAYKKIIEFNPPISLD